MLYRPEKSSGVKNASASPQRSLRDRSGNRRVQELEEQSDVQSDATSPKRRQPQSTHKIVGHSGQKKKASFTTSANHINQQKFSLFMYRRNSHMYQRIKNLLMKDKIIWNLYMYFIEMKIIIFLRSNICGLLVC
jgi:hypothetical protein